MLPHTTTTQDNQKPRERRTHTPIEQDKIKSVQFLSNATLYNQIVEIANQRRRSMSNTIRLLLYTGLKEWKLQVLAGRTKKKDIEADYQKRLAEAELLAAQRQQKKNKKGGAVAAVTPVLFGDDDT